MDNTQLNNSSSSSSSAAAALFGMEISPNCYLPTNFEDPNDPFESALSSMVSSPTSNPGGFLPAGDGMMIRELIGRLGTICDSGEISPQSCIATASNTPLNSPPKFSLSSLPIINQAGHPPSLAYFNGDPGFAERAAKFSPFGRGEMVIGNGSGAMDNLVDSREGSSVSHEQNMNNTGGGGDVGVLKDANSRKRKSISKAKVKESPSPPKDDKGGAEADAGNDDDEESKAKRSKTDDVEKKGENRGESNNNNNNKSKDKEGNSNSNNSNNKETAKPEPPKDYIHVRARRGQATDSHSLAERVRREKISERMKFLQDLVPGCNKVTGKATVLDEIINYVQSLQRQVEFLSMKLATVNPRMDFNMEALLSKDMWECRGSTLPQTMYTLDQNSAQAFPFGLQPSQQLPPTLLNGIPNVAQNPLPVNPLNANAIHRSPALQVPSMSGLTDPMIQLPTFCDDDLQSIVQMGISQNLTQTAGASVNAQMKVEL